MKPNSINVITIDGTSGSGKTTISRLLAKQLRYSLLDSGKLYRSAGYILSKNNQSLTNPSNISQLISCIELKTNPNTFEYEIYYKKNKIDHLLYDEIAGRNASIVSKIPRVRECMLKIQHSCLQGPYCIAVHSFRSLCSIGTPSCSITWRRLEFLVARRLPKLQIRTSGRWQRRT